MSTEVQTDTKINLISSIMGLQDIDIREYHKHKAISRSGLMLLRRSPLHYWDKYIREDNLAIEETRDMIIGNAVHCHALENDQFDDRYLVIPKVDKRTKAGKEEWERITELSLTKQTLYEEEFETILEISKAIENNKTALELISNALYEKSIFWTDPDTGVACKCRPDILHNNIVVDLKTAKDASPREFQKAIYNYGYHIQAAMIKEGLKIACNKDITEFVYIVIEKNRPYALGIYLLDEQALQEGRKEFKKYLSVFKNCLNSNEWPSYETRQISLPSFANYL